MNSSLGFVYTTRDVPVGSSLFICSWLRERVLVATERETTGIRMPYSGSARSLYVPKSIRYITPRIRDSNAHYTKSTQSVGRGTSLVAPPADGFVDAFLTVPSQYLFTISHITELRAVRWSLRLPRCCCIRVRCTNTPRPGDTDGGGFFLHTATRNTESSADAIKRAGVRDGHPR